MSSTPNKFISRTYATTGAQAMIVLPVKVQGSILFSVKAGDSDSFSVEVQIGPDATRVKIPAYKNSLGDTVGRLPPECYAVGLNIVANVSAAIVFEINSN